MGHSGWSNDQPLILTLPGGATSGARIVIDGTRDAIFVYDASNALFASLAASAGSDDGHGNAYLAGLTFYTGGHVIGNWSETGWELITPGTLGSKILVQPVSSANVSPQLQFSDGLTPSGALPGEIFVENGAVTAGQDTAFVLGPAAPASVDAHQSETMLLMTAGGASDGASMSLRFSGSATEDYLTLDKTGATTTGALVSTQPLSSPATAEGWHPLSLNAGFQTLAGFGTPRYEIQNINGKRTVLSGTVQLVGNQAQGTVIATLPPAYAPATNTVILITANNLSGGSGQTESLDVDTNGNIRLGHAGSNGNYVSLYGASFELD